ncbi:hypothetical protein CEP54_010305 [Fusarium duplospermum]|uniref:Peptidase S8/S53 domain-containing protein n=1 Tax=Fusarium duplospermum TaxID=1325734 RepID=A0A428PKU8_9HYPO|nr:hypothetical protein CEP54_010305 [Fusarium duplospermum]
MTCNKDENPVDTAKRLVQLTIESLANSNEAESLALFNSRAALNFRLNLALLELEPKQGQPVPQNNQRLSIYAISLYRVLEDFFGKDIDSHLKTGSPHQGFQVALARNSRDEAKSPKPPSIRLPETPQALAHLEKQILGLRNPNSSRPASSHHRTTIRDDHDVNKDNESESENESHTINTTKANFLSRNGRDPDPAVGSMPITFESEDTTDEQKLGKAFMDQAEKFYRKKIERIEGKRAIKVAVLDTGVNEDQVHFKGVREVKALVVAVAPHVDLYIAKVSKTNEGTGVDQWVKAIDWAIELEVDIINISAKVPNDKKIRKPIEEAEMRGIIILAAASNDGANLPRAFPAWTSFSTAIAAGMAANILTLVENIPDESKDDDTQWIGF